MKTFKFTLKERNGEQEYSYDYLVYAENLIDADTLAHKQAKEWYGDPDVEYNPDVNCYEFFGGCITTEISPILECTIKEFTKDLVNRYTLK